EPVDDETRTAVSTFEHRTHELAERAKPPPKELRKPVGHHTGPMLTPSQDAIRALPLPTICRSKKAGTGWPAEPKKIAASTPPSLMATRSIVAGIRFFPLLP